MFIIGNHMEDISYTEETEGKNDDPHLAPKPPKAHNLLSSPQEAQINIEEEHSNSPQADPAINFTQFKTLLWYSLGLKSIDSSEEAFENVRIDYGKYFMIKNGLSI
jgi:hypothetical protein